MTCFLELPFDLGLEDEAGGLLLEDRQPLWDGWSSADVAEISQLTSIADDLGPGTRWLIRRGDIRTHPPLLAAEELFSDWVDPLLSRQQARQRRRERERWSEAGLTQPLSVAALTRFVATSEVPTGPDERFSEIYDQARSDFDRVLTLLGLTTQHWWLAPVSDRQLPGLLPVITELVGPHQVPKHHPPKRSGSVFLVPLHDVLPNLSDEPFVSRQDLDQLAGLINAYNHGELAFLPVFELLHEAGGDLNVGRPTQALILSSSATELFVTTLVRVGGSAVGWDSQRIERAMKAPFKNRIEDHLSAIVGFPIDLADTATPWGLWWATGYRIRNEFMHGGTEPTRAEAFEAWRSVCDLFTATRALLLGDAQLAEVAEQMPFQANYTLGNSGT